LYFCCCVRLTLISYRLFYYFFSSE
jgi:hypothetical protein